MQKKDWGGPIGLGSPGLQKLHYAAQKDLAQCIEKELGNNSGGGSTAKKRKTASIDPGSHSKKPPLP